MTGLGVLYTGGQGVEQDLNEAMRWLLKAKAQGEDVSRHLVAVVKERKRQNAALAFVSGPAPDCEVEVTGLVNRPELNGARARVVRYIDKDQWEVKLNDGYGIVAVKSVNLRVVKGQTR